MVERSRRPGVAGALILILLGLWFLAVQVVPGLEHWAYGERGWPLAVIAVGVLLLVVGLVTGVPGMAVPACIVGGIGGLLYWQNATGNWGSWAYAWALIPGFVGVGIILAGLLQRRWRDVESGAWLLLISLLLFAAFGSFLGAWAPFGAYWPVLLILLGLLLLGRALLRR